MRKDNILPGKIRPKAVFWQDRPVHVWVPIDMSKRNQERVFDGPNDIDACWVHMNHMDTSRADDHMIDDDIYDTGICSELTDERFSSCACMYRVWFWSTFKQSICF